MSLAQLSPISVQANPADVNPQVKAEQFTSTPQAAQAALKTAQVAKTDTVTISAQALKRLANDDDTVNENVSEKASEALRGKK